MQNMQNTGYAAGPSAFKNPTAETAIRRVISQASDKHQRLHALCNRLEQFADRLEPQPVVTTSAGEAKAPETSDLNSLHRRLSEMGQTLDWLDQIADRLDRIA